MNQKKQWKRLLIAIPVIILIGVLLYYKNSAMRESKYSKQYLDVFDTVSVITGYGTSEKQFQKKADELHEQLVYYHELFDIYHNYEGINNLMLLNEQCPSNTITVNKDMMDFLLYSKKMEKESNGQTNIALGSVLEIWHTYREAGINHPEQAELPEYKKLLEAGGHVDINNLILDEDKRTVHFADASMRLDVGGIAKGYAVEQVAQYAKKKGWDNILLNVGGNIRAVGSKPDGSNWTIGIQDPFGETADDYLKTFQISDKSMVTSGNYQRYYTVNGKKYCHIIDPKTLYPAEYVAAVTVQCVDSAKADVFSTALFNMSIEDGKALAKKNPDIQVLWVTNEGEIIMTDGFGD